MISLLRSWMWGSAVRESRIDFIAEQSPWSGPVTWISVGNQELKVSIDFRSTEVTFWKKCPLLVHGGCYERSESFQSLMNVHDDLIMGIDTVRVPDDRLSRVFIEISGRSSYVRGLDVAGSVGLGSEILFNRILEISNNSTSSIRIQEIRNTRGVYFVPQSSAPGRGRFEQVSFLASLNGHQFTWAIDLGMDDIVVPIDLLEFFAETLPLEKNDYLVGDSGRLLARCDKLKPIVLSVGTLSISIPGGGANAPGNQWCMSVIVVADDDDADVIQIGRVLLSAVQALIVHPSLNRVGFIPLSAPIGNHVVLQHRFPMMAPVFEFPPLEGIRGTIRFERAKQIANSDLVLVNEEPEEFKGIEIDKTRISCWTFHRIKEDASIRRNHMKPIPGQFSSIELESSVGGIEFRLRNDPNKPRIGGRILMNSRSVRVCRLEKVRFEVIDPPAVAVLDSHTHELIGTECGVCGELLIQGDEVQGIKGCVHKFHPNCVVPWLTSKLEAGCPTCRQKVDKRTVFT